MVLHRMLHLRIVIVMSTLTMNPERTIATAGIKSALDHYQASKADTQYDADGRENWAGPQFNLAAGLAWVALEVQATLALEWPTIPAPSDPARTAWEAKISDMLTQAEDGYYLPGFADAGRA